MLKQRGGNPIRYEDCLISSFREQPKKYENNKLGSFDDILKELENVRWYHGSIARNTAVIILLNNAQDGTYLMRKSDSHAGFAVSVRTTSTVKHYKIDYCKEDNTLKLGDVIFYSIPQLLNHFKSKPVIGGESGLSDKLLYPYFNDAKEIPDYTGIHRQAMLGENYNRNRETEDIEPETIAPREGLLIKRGNIRKSWKERWFVVNRNYMEYFENRKSKSPIRTLDLRLAEEVAEDFIDEKKNCFRLVFPNRIFYMVGNSPMDAKDWIDYLQWKIDYYKNLKK